MLATYDKEGSIIGFCAEMHFNASSFSFLIVCLRVCFIILSGISCRVFQDFMSHHNSYIQVTCNLDKYIILFQKHFRPLPVGPNISTCGTERLNKARLHLCNDYIYFQKTHNKICQKRKLRLRAHMVRTPSARLNMYVRFIT